MFSNSSVGTHLAFGFISVVVAMLVMAVIGLVYIVSLALRQRNLQQDLQLMERLLQDDEENGR